MPTHRYEDRPTCTRPGCSNPAAIRLDYYDGTANYRSICSTHHTHTWHPSLQYRKTYCENQDGRLGFVCTSNIQWQGMLDVDHINGDPSDNRRQNFQTLCACCHRFKTHKNGDVHTPGRLSLGVI